MSHQLSPSQRSIIDFNQENKGFASWETSSDYLWSPKLRSKKDDGQAKHVHIINNIKIHTHPTTHTYICLFHYPGATHFSLKNKIWKSTNILEEKKQFISIPEELHS